MTIVPSVWCGKPQLLVVDGGEVLFAPLGLEGAGGGEHDECQARQELPVFEERLAVERPVDDD